MLSGTTFNQRGPERWRCFFCSFVLHVTTAWGENVHLHLRVFFRQYSILIDAQIFANIQYWLPTTQVPEDAWTMDDQLAVPWDTNIVQKTIYNRENNFTREKAPLANSFVLSWAATFCNQGRYYFRIQLISYGQALLSRLLGTERAKLYSNLRKIVQQRARNGGLVSKWKSGWEWKVGEYNLLKCSPDQQLGSRQQKCESATCVSSSKDVMCSWSVWDKPLDACAEEVWGHFIPRQSVPRHISSRDNICPGTLCCGTKCPQTCSTRGHRRRMILSMLDSFAADRYYGNGKEISGFAEE